MARGRSSALNDVALHANDAWGETLIKLFDFHLVLS